jgi:hypothetical protein
MPSESHYGESELRALVKRLLRSNKPRTDTPIIISTVEGDYHSSVGRVLKREGTHVQALVDAALERGRAVKIFLPKSIYVAEVEKCASHKTLFKIDLALQLN